MGRCCDRLHLELAPYIGGVLAAGIRLGRYVVGFTSSGEGLYKNC